MAGHDHRGPVSSDAAAARSGGPANARRQRVLRLRRDRPRRVRLPGPRAGRLAGGLALPLELYLGEPAGHPALSLVSMAGPSAGLGRRALALSPGPSGGRRRATGRALPAGRRVVLFEAAAPLGVHSCRAGWRRGGDLAPRRAPRTGGDPCDGDDLARQQRRGPDFDGSPPALGHGAAVLGDGGRLAAAAWRRRQVDARRPGGDGGTPADLPPARPAGGRGAAYLVAPARLPARGPLCGGHGAAAAALPRLSLPGLAQLARCPVRDPAPVGCRRPVRLHRALAPDREPPDRRRHLAPAPAR